MKISKPTQYVIAVGGILAIALLAWNFYNNSQENSSITSPPEATSSATPAAKASATPAAKASATPAAKASATPAAKASATPAAKASATPAAKDSSSPNALAFRDAVNKATLAAQLTQTAKTKTQWNVVANNWQAAIDLMKVVPKANPNYQVAQKKVVEYQNKLNYAQKASKLAN